MGTWNVYIPIARNISNHEPKYTYTIYAYKFTGLYNILLTTTFS